MDGDWRGAIAACLPALPGWTSVEKGVRLAELVLETRGEASVEIGVFGGRGTVALALGHGVLGRGRVYAIDPWERAAAIEGSNGPVNDAWWAEVDYETAFHGFLRTILRLGLSEQCEVMRARAADAVRLFAERSIAVLHQDGNRSPEVSCREVEQWTPKLRTGGYWVLNDARWASMRAAQEVIAAGPFELVEDHEDWRVYRKHRRRRGRLSPRLPYLPRAAEPRSARRRADRAVAVEQRSATDRSDSSAPRSATTVVSSPGASSAASGISIVFSTCREQPRFDWFIASLTRQLAAGDDLELVVVDDCWSAERGGELDALVNGRFPLCHVPPKPSPYRGPHRRTRRDLFAAASARNTGILHAARPYVVFVDDCAVLMPGWWSAVRRAARDGYVVAGAREMHWRMEVVDGVLAASRVTRLGLDSRYEVLPDSPLVPMGGGQLYTHSCGVPRELLIAVDGFDELCDPVGGEDYHLGLRLEWVGAPLYFDRGMLTVESEELNRQRGSRRRVDRLLPRAEYMRRLREFGPTRRSTGGRHDCSHMLLDILHGTGHVRSLGNAFTLAELERGGDLTALAPRFATRYWFDGTPLSSL